MIRVVFFDLGLTLIDSQHRPFPHAVEALTTIQSFTAADGRKLLTGLVSDFDLPAPPATPAKIKAIFERYLGMLDGTGLRPLFEPVARRVTLSTHAGAMKPDRKIFEKAVARLRSKAALKECLFITENPDHVRAVRTKLRMSALQFRSGASAAFDFDDWLQAPPMVAHLLGGAGGPNAEAALRHHLSRAHGFDLQAVEGPKRGAKTSVRGTLWKPVGRSAGDALADVHAPFPVEGEVTRGPGGQIRSVCLGDPAPSDVTEAASLVRSLARHGEIEGSGPRRVGTSALTHDIETDDQGRRKLVRKRFRAF
jgi:hypothetical protein